jgi:hypothetical protein
MSVESGKCKHESCTCLVAADQSYCSDACRPTRESANHPETCDCAHTECGSTLSESLLEG